MAERDPATPSSTVDSIKAVVALEEQFERDRPWTGKLADGIAGLVGTITFVIVHLVILAAWIAVNRNAIPGVPAFDPFPFQLLCMIVSIEGVLLSTFVLIKQNRMSLRSDRRGHLDLQINLLSEKEITKALQMLERLAAEAGVAKHDPELKELERVTAVQGLAKELDEKLPQE